MNLRPKHRGRRLVTWVLEDTDTPLGIKGGRLILETHLFVKSFVMIFQAYQPLWRILLLCISMVLVYMSSMPPNGPTTKEDKEVEKRTYEKILTKLGPFLTVVSHESVPI